MTNQPPYQFDESIDAREAMDALKQGDVVRLSAYIQHLAKMCNHDLPNYIESSWQPDKDKGSDRLGDQDEIITECDGTPLNFYQDLEMTSPDSAAQTLRESGKFLEEFAKAFLPTGTSEMRLHIKRRKPGGKKLPIHKKRRRVRNIEKLTKKHGKKEAALAEKNPPGYSRSNYYKQQAELKKR